MARYVPTDDEIELMSAEQLEEFLATGTVSTPIVDAAPQVAHESDSSSSVSGGSPSSGAASHSLSADAAHSPAASRSAGTVESAGSRGEDASSIVTRTADASSRLPGRAGAALDLIDTPAPRWGWMMVVTSLVAIASCWHLIAAEIDQLKNPMGSLSCDINPLVSCGASLNVWQGNLLGVPNAFIGAMAFAALAVLGGLSALGVRLPRVAWWGMLAGCVGGLVFVGWFLGVSVLTFHKLCPYCMIIWSMTIPIATTTWGWAGKLGVIGCSVSGEKLFAARWWAAFALVLIVIAIIGISFAGQWALLLS
ncbi:vitamin K epoxide reductase family protein [Actinomyces vulturis]|uniref:vitamin K epoxide reductase family protein n=1 Tax=Actinomyces vulturis TaxID=1857645 RepID=UPI000830796B|nr:vitamin K epoxide reductase family protein [Actinomyces vulturis]